MRWRWWTNKRKLNKIFPWGRSISSISYDAFKFDFGKDDDNIFYNNFTIHNTNDAGERLLPQTTQILIGEFKKAMILNATSLLDKQIDDNYVTISDERGKEWITFSLISTQLDRIWREMILYNNRKYREFCQDIVGGYIHRWIPMNTLKDDTYTRYIFHKNKIFWYRDNSLYDQWKENYQKYETIMNLSQLKDSIAFIKELLETNSVEEILQKLDSSFSLNIEFLINQDFGIDLTNSDEEWYTLLQELLDINFPNIMIKWVESKLRISSDSSLILLVEYLKFLIIKSKFPSDWVPSYFVDKVWIEHWVLTKHFSEVWNQIFRVDEDILHYNKTSKDVKEFEEKYTRTLELYKEMFGWDPHPQIWRNWNTEFEEFDEHRVIVNLERLVNYYRFERDFIAQHSQNLGWSSVSFEKLVDEFAIQNPTKIYGSDYENTKIIIENRNKRLQALKTSSISKYLWRANFKSTENDQSCEFIEKNQELGVYCIGGLKFSQGKDYNIYYNLSYSETENILINLDDYADHSWESIHLYPNSFEFGLKLNKHF